MSEEVHHSGLLSTLSWIFNWRVPKVSHPQPWDVALNNYSTYAVSSKQQRRRQQQQSQKWSRRKRKRNRIRQRISVSGANSRLPVSGFQHRIASVENFGNSQRHPYQFEKPLQYFDASQVYFYPAAASQKWKQIAEKGKKKEKNREKFLEQNKQKEYSRKISQKSWWLISCHAKQDFSSLRETVRLAQVI